MSRKYCPECGEPYEGEVKFCPNCGFSFTPQKQDDKTNSILQPPVKKIGCIQQGCGCLTFVLILLFMISVFAPTENTSNSTGGTTGSDKPDLQVLNFKACNGDFGAKMVCGTVVNNTDSTKSYAQVEINLYDKSGNIVGSTLANINNLEPHTKWKFEAPVVEDSARTFKIKEVTGF